MFWSSFIFEIWAQTPVCSQRGPSQTIVWSLNSERRGRIKKQVLSPVSPLSGAAPALYNLHGSADARAQNRFWQDPGWPRPLRWDWIWQLESWGRVTDWQGKIFCSKYARKSVQYCSTIFNSESIHFIAKYLPLETGAWRWSFWRLRRWC